MIINLPLGASVRLALLAVVCGAATPAVAEEVQFHQAQNEVMVAGDGIVLMPIDLSGYLPLAGAGISYFRGLRETYGVMVRAGVGLGAHDDIDVGLIHAEVGLGLTLSAAGRARLRVIPTMGAAFALAKAVDLASGAGWITAGAEVEGTYWLGRSVGLTASLNERLLVSPGDLADCGLLHSAALGVTLRF